MNKNKIIKLEDLSTNDLKAKVYDYVIEVQRLQSVIEIINKEIGERNFKAEKPEISELDNIMENPLGKIKNISINKNKE